MLSQAGQPRGLGPQTLWPTPVPPPRRNDNSTLPCTLPISALSASVTPPSFPSLPPLARFAEPAAASSLQRPPCRSNNDDNSSTNDDNTSNNTNNNGDGT